MTRDEAAYKIAHSFYDSASDRWDFVKARAEKLVDAFSDLGMLKLDEPKGIETHIEYFLGTYTGPRFLQYLSDNGFKIVEK